MSFLPRVHNCPTCTCPSSLHQEEPLPDWMEDILKFEEVNPKVSMVDACWFGMGFDDAEKYYKKEIKESHEARIKAENEMMDMLVKSSEKGHLQDFYDCGGAEERDPIERLRFFCSLAMNGKDWLDVEQFFDAVINKGE